MADWKPYLDHAVKGHMITGGGMYGLDGQTYAQTADFKMRPNEVKEVNALFFDPNGLAGTPLNIAGNEYTCVGGEPDKDMYLQDGDAGIFVSKCGQFLVVGYHDEDIKPNACGTAIRKIAFYLRQGSEKSQSSSSWQPYVDHAIKSWLVVKAGGIYDLSGRPWAASPGFNLKPVEVFMVTSHFARPQELGGKQIKIGGKEYTVTGGEENKEVYAARNEEGVVFRKCGNSITGSFVVVGYHDHTIRPSAIRIALLKVAEWFDAAAAGK